MLNSKSLIEVRISGSHNFDAWFASNVYNLDEAVGLLVRLLSDSGADVACTIEKLEESEIVVFYEYDIISHLSRDRRESTEPKATHREYYYRFIGSTRYLAFTAHAFGVAHPHLLSENVRTHLEKLQAEADRRAAEEELYIMIRDDLLEYGDNAIMPRWGDSSAWQYDGQSKTIFNRLVEEKILVQCRNCDEYISSRTSFGVCIRCSGWLDCPKCGQYHCICDGWRQDDDENEDPLAGDVEPTGGYLEPEISAFDAHRLSVMRQHGDWV